jgi:putative membrane protein
MITLATLPQYWHDGAGFHWWFPLFPLAGFLIFWLVVWFVLRRLWWRGGCGPAGGHTSAESALGRRYAEGEIDEQEYRARLEVLRDTVRRR